MNERETSTEEIPSQRVTDGDTFLALLERRRSTRMFREQPVPPELIERLVRAATLMPTSCNRQLWHFVAITDSEIKAKASRHSDAQQSYF